MSSTVSEVARDKAAKLLKKRGSASSLMSGSEHGHTRASQHSVQQARHHGSVSTISFMDEPHDTFRGPPVQLEPTYQINPSRRFPVGAVKGILRDVLESYLAEEKYEPELCKQMTKTISEVIKARVKDLLVPRFKVIVIISIGELKDQGMCVGSRCLWDPQNDTFSSYEFRNRELFAIAEAYGIYHE